MNTFGLRLLLLSFILAVLAGCQSVGGLNYFQVKAVKKEGFELTDEGWYLGLPDRILFKVDQAIITDTNKKNLIGLANRLRATKIRKLKIQGHTDNTGSDTHNLDLSKRRATAVGSLMIDGGFEDSNIFIEPYGSSRPVTTNDTEEGRSENRRVAIIIVPD